MGTIFSSYPIASWTVGGLRLAFPANRLRESGGNRLVMRDRAFRPGSKLDSTGSKAKQYEFTIIFEQSITEPDLARVNQNRPLYPDVLNELILSFDIQETGDLVVPTIGKRRCRAADYTRIESVDEDDAAGVVFTFVEDNEDSVDARSIQVPTANANARRSGEQTTFTNQSDASWSESLIQLEKGMSDLEDFVNTPGDIAQDVEQTAATVERLGESAKRIHSTAGRPGRDGWRFVDGEKSEREVVKARDLAARARNDARRGRPKIQSVVVSDDTSLFRLAALLRQPLDDLREINTELESDFFIPKGTVIKIFAFDALATNAQTA